MPLFKPSKIVAVGLNYYDHAKELGMTVPQQPVIFLKPASTVIASGQAIIYPQSSHQVDYEGELAVVIKNRTKNITPEQAPDHILGYTCANDVTARDLQKIDGQWTRAKSFDTFCPLGPRLADDLDPKNLKIETRVNGQVKQSSNTSNMIFDVYYLISFISQVMPLLPGDVVITGTPPGVGPLQVGDVVEVEIEGIGILENKIVRGQPIS